MSRRALHAAALAVPAALGPAPTPAQPLPPLAAPAASAASVTSAAPEARWRVATLPRQQPPVTRFVPLPPGERAGVAIEADGSYGNLVLELPGRPAPRRLAWSWRVEQPNPRADLRRKDGDDSPVKVCLSFDLPLERVPFVERQLLRLARSSSGQALPAATLCWAWGHDEPVGQVIENPFSRRVRTLVLRGRADGSGRWLDESRDVAADFRLAFGDEADAPPPLLALGVAGDADNTGGRSRAAVAGLRMDE